MRWRALLVGAILGDYGSIGARDCLLNQFSKQDRLSTDELVHRVDVDVSAACDLSNCRASISALDHDGACGVDDALPGPFRAFSTCGVVVGGPVDVCSTSVALVIRECFGLNIGVAMAYAFTQDVPIDAGFYDRFVEERLHPVVHRLLSEVFGADLPPEPERTDLRVVHAWTQ